MEPSEDIVEVVAAALAPHLPEDLARAQARFCATLAKANLQLNLTGVTEPRAMAVRHVLDSLLALPLLDGDGPLVDLGSGGGVPGVPLALAQPDRPVVLIESRARKAAALEAIVAELGLAPRVRVVAQRGEAWLAGNRVDTIVTRAVGSVDDQLRLLGRHRERFRQLVLYKGPAVDDELERARARMTREDWREPRRVEAQLPDGAGQRVLLVFESAARSA